MRKRILIFLLCLFCGGYLQAPLFADLEERENPFPLEIGFLFNSHKQAIKIAREGQVKEGIQMLELILPKLRDFPEVQADYLLLLSWDNQWQKMTNAYEALPEKMTLPEYILPSLAKGYRIQQKYEKARALYDSYIQEHPDDREAHRGLAYTLLDANRLKEAHRFLKNRLDVEPGFKEWHFLLARWAYLKMDHETFTEEAAKTLLIVERDKREDVRVNKELKRLMDLVYKEFIELARRGHYEEGLKKLARFEEIGYLNPNLDWDRIVILSWAGRYLEALERAEQLTDVTVLPQYVRNAIAIAYRETGQPEKARIWDTNVLPPVPTPKPKTQPLPEITSESMQKSNDSRPTLDDQIKKLYELGEALESKEEYLAASDTYEAIKKANPAHQAPRNLRTRSFLDIGAVSLAEKEIHLASSDIDPEIMHRARGDRAMYYINWKEPKRAQQVLEKNLYYYQSLIGQRNRTRDSGNKTPLKLDHTEDIQRFAESMRQIMIEQDATTFDSGVGQHYLRSIWDEILALRLEERMEDLLILYQEALNLQLSIPFWVTQSAADAYLYLRRPEKALELYSQLDQENPGGYNIRMALYHTYVELRKFKQAEELLEVLDKETPVQIMDRGIFRKNWQKAEIALEKGWLLMYRDRLASAYDYFESLMQRAPYNTNIRSAQAHLHLWRGWPRRALEDFEIIRTLDPKHKVARMGHAAAAHQMLQTEKAEEIIDGLQLEFPRDKHIRKTKRRFELEKKRTLVVDSTNVLENHGSDDYFLSVYLDQPITRTLKLFSNTIFRWTNQKNNDNTLRRQYYGATYRLGTDWIFKGAFSSEYDITEEIGMLAEATYKPNDYWTLLASFEDKLYDIPVRSRSQGINAREVNVNMTYRAHENFSSVVGGSLRRYTDGNLHSSYTLRSDHSLYDDSHWKLRVGTEWYGSHNSKQDVAYFSPEYLYSAYLIPSLEHVWHHVYEKRFSHKVFLGFGLQKQHNFGLKDLWLARYEQDYTLSDIFAVLFGLQFTRKTYDDEDVTDLNGYMHMRSKF